ncbi:MAG: sulfotransferase [Rhizomicrobium sp.]
MSSAANYPVLDRILHHIALGNLELQKSLADIEDRTHSHALRQVRIERPVFITALPRAGTTLLLELLVGSGAFAAHTYRDMPFVLCPLTWRSIARGFQRSASPRERAHGDGMTIDFDSPEAFEEVIWKAFWRDGHAGGRIRACSQSDRDPEFEAAFRDHLRKVIVLRSEAGRNILRYVSKNNANIARLPLLAALFPDCTIVLPFRDPMEHARSLARQHANFLALHKKDAFARKYMEWIGHYEFGAVFRPFEFCPVPPERGTGPDYWLEYWASAYEYVLDNAPSRTVFVDYNRLCDNPEASLRCVAAAVGIADASLVWQAARLRIAQRQPETLATTRPSHVHDVYERLCDRALAVTAARATEDRCQGAA